MCVALSSRRAIEVEQRRIWFKFSPVFEPFGVVPPLLYILQTSQLPSVIVRRTCTVFHLLKTAHTDKMKS